MSFCIINNGCDVTYKKPTDNIRKKFGITASDFLFVFVGNINPNKNQSQVVEALHLLSTLGIKNIKCLFVGGGDVDSIRQKVNKYNIQDSAIVVGYVDKTELNNFYSAADATILTSLSEGFGLSIIEGFVYGKPCLTFADLPAVKDLYCESAMMLCPTRDTHKLSECMERMKNHGWSSDIIKRHASSFSFEEMSANYIGFYKEIISEK